MLIKRGTAMEQFQKYSLIVDKNMSVISAGELFLSYIGKSKLGNLDQVVPPQDMIQLKNAVFAIAVIQSGAVSLAGLAITNSLSLGALYGYKTFTLLAALRTILLLTRKPRRGVIINKM